MSEPVINRNINTQGRKVDMFPLSTKGGKKGRYGMVQYSVVSVLNEGGTGLTEVTKAIELVMGRGVAGDSKPNIVNGLDNDARKARSRARRRRGAAVVVGALGTLISGAALSKDVGFGLALEVGTTWATKELWTAAGKQQAQATELDAAREMLNSRLPGSRLPRIRRKFRPHVFKNVVVKATPADQPSSI